MPGRVHNEVCRCCRILAALALKFCGGVARCNSYMTSYWMSCVGMYEFSGNLDKSAWSYTYVRHAKKNLLVI